MTAPNAQVHDFKPGASRRKTLRSAKTASQTQLSGEAREAIRRVAEAADAESLSEVRLALVWLELARGISSIVDGFFKGDRCYLILRTRIADAAHPIEGRRLEILEQVLAGSRQKNIAIDLQLAPSTVALNSKLALESLGAVGKPSRAHPLLMLLVRACKETESWKARVATFMVQDDSELRVIAVPRPDHHLNKSLPNAELAVIRSLIEGHSYREIADERGTSTRTIANQISAVFRRLRVSGRNELVQRLFRDTTAASDPGNPTAPSGPNGPERPHPPSTLVPPSLERAEVRAVGTVRRSA